MTNKKQNYQDYVIKDGKFIGRFEDMYQATDDPWEQSGVKTINDPRRLMIHEWIVKQSQTEEIRSVEIGCDFGHFTNRLNAQGLVSCGSDISQTAIDHATALYPDCVFACCDILDFDFYQDQQVNHLMMLEISWYVLDKLKSFIAACQSYATQLQKPVYVSHVLKTYSKDTKKYGRKYFSTHQEILAYFGLDYIAERLFDGQIDGAAGSVFIAKIMPES